MQINSNIEPRLQTGCAQPYVAICLNVFEHEWHTTRLAVLEVKEWLEAKAVKIAGPLFYRYWVQGNTYVPHRLEVGFPVQQSITVDSGLVSGAIPGGTFATLVHCEAYKNITQTYNALDQWAQVQGLNWKTQQDGSTELWSGRFEFHLNCNIYAQEHEPGRIAVALLVNN